MKNTNAVIFEIIVGVTIGLILAIITQLCWNSSIAPLIGAKSCSFWQAFGMNVFGSIVFKDTVTLKKES